MEVGADKGETKRKFVPIKMSLNASRFFGKQLEQHWQSIKKFTTIFYLT
jgi:hypothetical protein